MNYSIFSLKNKRCETINRNIDALDEAFWEISEHSFPNEMNLFKFFIFFKIFLMNFFTKNSYIKSIIFLKGIGKINL